MAAQINVGISEQKCTKILAPPGGQDSISFSTDTPSSHSSNANLCQVARNMSNVFGGTDHGMKSKGGVKSCQEARQKSTVFTAPNEQIPVKPCTKPAKPSEDVITAKGGKEEPLRTSVQVRAPPGGASHIFFG